MNDTPEQADPGAGTTSRGRTVDERFSQRIHIQVPHRHNPKLATLLEQANADDEVYALWLAANVNAIDRLNLTDHGPVHVKIVTNIALRLLRLLADRDIEPGVVRDYGLGPDDAEVVVAAAALFHDVGMAIHRTDHETYSLFVATPLLDRLLSPLYDRRMAAILRSEILHAIIAHRSEGRPLTLEAGVVRLADALDLAKGRSRIPFEAGSTSIHSLSAAAIEAVHIEPGEAMPVRLRIEMSNSAGVFQLDQLLREKLVGSGLEPYIQLEASIEGETEKRLFRDYRL